MHKTLLIYNTVTFYIFGDVVWTNVPSEFRDEVAKKNYLLIITFLLY